MAEILIVDDSEVERQLAAGLLRRSGETSIQFAENGRDALARIRQSEEQESLPDLILTDLVMPELDGLELVKVVRSRYPHVPVVLMTAYGNERIASDALRFGAVSYVPKSQRSERLVSTVRQVLARSRADRQRKRLMECVQDLECSFILDADPTLVRPLVDFVQQALCGVPLTDAAGRIRLGIALEEVLLNAVYHGALRVSRSQLEKSRGLQTDDEVAQLVSQLPAEQEKRDRKIAVRISISAFEAKFVVCDRGAGFDPVVIRGEPSDSFERGRNRGLTLISSLADEVTYNEMGNEVTLRKRRDSGACPLPQ